MFFSGAACFFVKQFSRYGYTSGRCINDTGQIQSSGSWGNLSFLAYSYNSCLDPAAQFRFRDNGAMLNLKRQGCLAAFNKPGYDLDMLYIYVDSVSLDTAACAQKPNEGIYRAITQTPRGALSVYYKGKDKSSFETWCAWYRHSYQLHKKYGINYYMGVRAPCHSIYSTQKFIFGKFLCRQVRMTRNFLLNFYASLESTLKMMTLTICSQLWERDELSIICFIIYLKNSWFLIG
jgi:hypothetical protein